MTKTKTQTFSEESIRELIAETEKERDDFIAEINRQIAPQVAAFNGKIEVLQKLLGENGQEPIEES